MERGKDKMRESRVRERELGKEGGGGRMRSLCVLSL